MLFLIYFILIIYNVYLVFGINVVPVISIENQVNETENNYVNSSEGLQYLPFIMLADKNKDTSEYWRQTEILSLVRNAEMDIDYEKCEKTSPSENLLEIATSRIVYPICKSRIDFQLCPQCPHFNNYTECELFRDSCKERRVHPSEYRSYCDRKYGRWRAMFVPADYSQCRCCDECIFYRELDQSCIQDDYSFESEEFLPVTTIDFRAGCNPYWGHPEQEFRALRCDKVLRRCVPISVPQLPNEGFGVRRSYRMEPVSNEDCPMGCRGFQCQGGQVQEKDCPTGGFIPDKDQCNCCGRCSIYQQLNEKCAEFKNTFHNVSGTVEIEVEEEFLEPGCDDGLVCRQGRCQDIHTVLAPNVGRQKREGGDAVPYEPCKRELKYFKKRYGPEGHLHFEAPQCTPLWLYAPVQCRRFVCYCALEDGTFIEGIKVPRVEVSNMNCDCAREKCRTGSKIECDGYGNYREFEFTNMYADWLNQNPEDQNETTTSANE